MPETPPFLGGKPPAQAPEKKAGIFGKGKPAAPAGESIAELSAQLNNISRRLKMMEESYINTRKKMQMSETTMLKFEKKLNSGTKDIHDELTEFKREFFDLRDKAKLIVKELKLCAKSEDIKVLENYINLWEPLNFVTKNEVEKVIEQKIGELNQNL